MSFAARFIPLLALAAAFPVLADFPRPPDTIEAAQHLEQADALPLSAFYDPPAKLGAPGHLLRSAPAADFALPEGIKAVRILYGSLSATGTPVAGSAVVLLPTGRPPAGGWKVIAWAHGTSGMARQCAPSLMKDLLYGDDGLFEMVRAGFAVVAADYHGLGTPGPHQYMDTAAQVNDIVYALPAARAAVRSLGRKWVAVGHSQGGQAAWGVAEREAQLHDSGYLGSISVAGATHLPWWVHHQAEHQGSGFYLSWVAYGVAARFPDFRPETMLSPVAQAHYREVTQQGCWYTGYAAYAGIGAGSMVKPGWEQDPTVRRFLAEIEVGTRPVTAPLLVLAGEADEAIPLDGVRDTVAKACAHGQKPYLRIYPGLGHDATMVKSVGDQLDWIRDRFAGRPASSNCGATPP